MNIFFITKRCTKTMPSWRHFVFSCILLLYKVLFLCLRLKRTPLWLSVFHPRADMFLPFSTRIIFQRFKHPRNTPPKRIFWKSEKSEKKKNIWINHPVQSSEFEWFIIKVLSYLRILLNKYYYYYYLSPHKKATESKVTSQEHGFAAVFYNKK